MDETIRVLVADSYPLLRDGLCAAVSGEPDLKLVGEATDGFEVQRLCRKVRPHVLVLDLALTGPTLVEVLTSVARSCPETKVLALAASLDNVDVPNLVAAGVHGCVLKSESREAVIQAIHTIMSVGSCFTGTAMEKVARGDPEEIDQIGAPALTERELKVLQLAAQGWTNKRIATSLEVSETTVERCFGSVFTTLGVTSRVEAVAWAVRNGLA